MIPTEGDVTKCQLELTQSRRNVAPNFKKRNASNEIHCGKDDPLVARQRPWQRRLHTRSENKVVIGDIDDMSGLYADVIGPGGVEAAKMAIEDFGGSVLGNKIEFTVSDHQNKPDVGAQKFREWADRDGVTMVLGGVEHGSQPGDEQCRQGEEDSIHCYRRKPARH